MRRGALAGIVSPGSCGGGHGRGGNDPGGIFDAVSVATRGGGWEDVLFGGRGLARGPVGPDCDQRHCSARTRNERGCAD